MPSHINAYDFIFNVLVEVSCSDLEVVRDANAAVAILYCLLIIVCFVGSIIGCAGACCVQQVRCSNMVMCKNTATPTFIVTLVPNNTESRIHVVNPSEATKLKNLPCLDNDDHDHSSVVVAGSSQRAHHANEKRLRNTLWKSGQHDDDEN